MSTPTSPAPPAAAEDADTMLRRHGFTVERETFPDKDGALWRHSLTAESADGVVVQTSWWAEADGGRRVSRWQNTAQWGVTADGLYVWFRSVSYLGRALTGDVAAYVRENGQPLPA